MASSPGCFETPAIVSGPCPAASRATWTGRSSDWREAVRIRKQADERVSALTHS
jgi:hypothetical protein